MYAASEAVGYELAGNSALFQGDYKIVRNRAPVGDNRWYLYDIVNDPGETRDLGDAMPGRFQAMQAAYEGYAEDNGVLAVPASYDQAFQGVYNGIRERYTPQILLALLTVLTLLPFYIVYRGAGRRRG